MSTVLENRTVERDQLRQAVLRHVTYSLGTAHPEGATTNAQALADDVPLQIDGACCFNFRGG